MTYTFFGDTLITYVISALILSTLALMRFKFFSGVYVTLLESGTSCLTPLKKRQTGCLFFTIYYILASLCLKVLNVTAARTSESTAIHKTAVT
jgi:hypothetical protein